MMKDRVKDESQNHHRLIFAKLVDQKAGDGRRKKRGEGQREINNCDFFHGDADALHVDLFVIKISKMMENV